MRFRPTHIGPDDAGARSRPTEVPVHFVRDAAGLRGCGAHERLLARTNATRRQWITYRERVTGCVATMTTRLDDNAPSDIR